MKNLLERTLAGIIISALMLCLAVIALVGEMISIPSLFSWQSLIIVIPTGLFISLMIFYVVLLEKGNNRYD